MRHRKHNHQLGVKTAHHASLLANLCCALIENGRIKTTLAKARALRPTIEKIITLAKKAHIAQDTAKKIHYRRLAIARLRNKDATKKLFDELVEQFLGREGGYTRIYKLALPRLGDAADMALIEFVEESTSKKKKKKAKKASKKTDSDKAENHSKAEAVAEQEDVAESQPQEEEKTQQEEDAALTEEENVAESSDETAEESPEPEDSQPEEEATEQINEDSADTSSEEEVEPEVKEDSKESK